MAARCAGLAALALLCGGCCCDRAALGLPREALSVAAPVGGSRAVVRNHPAMDPPSQSLWLVEAGGARHLLRRLSEDQDWCDLAVWSADGRRVAFLVQGIEADVYDAATRRELLIADLAPRRGYPPDRRVVDLEFAPDGETLRFRVCRRDGSDCGARLVREIAWRGVDGTPEEIR